MDTAEHEALAGPPSPPLAAYTGYLLRRAFVRTQDCGIRAMPPGRHPRDLGILAALQAAGRPSQRALGEIFGVNRTFMVKIADSLEADGLLTRERDPANRRSYALSITPAGKSAIAEMTRCAAQCEAELTAALTEPEHRRLVEMLRRILPELTPSMSADLTGMAAFLIPRAHLRVSAEAAPELSALGIAPRHSGTLITLKTMEPCSQRHLAASLGVSGPAVVANVDELEERGLIIRQRDPADRRVQLLRLTAEGRERLAAVVEIIDSVHARLASQVGGADELTELNALLIKITV